MANTTKSSPKKSPAKSPVDDEEKRIRLYLPDQEKYKFFRIRIAPSTIAQAGKGIFAVDEIPKGAEGVYKGVKRYVGTRSGDNVNALYSWDVHEYNEKTGVPKNRKTLLSVDAGNPKTSNWARYVNCGPTKKSNNISVEQRYDDIYYITDRDIKPGEELFVDYGIAYRREHLKMKGRY